MKTGKKYGGVVIPAVTPFTDDLQLDGAALQRMFDLFHQYAAHPFILGTTGEGASLPFSMKKEFYQLAGKLKKPGALLYAGISSTVFLESVALAKHSFDCGADVVVATLPSYYPLTENDMRRYLEQLADAVRGPMIIYNIPATTHMSIPLSVIDSISHHPNVVGIKDSERSEDRLKESLSLWSNRNDFSHFLGWAAKSADAVLSGSDGLVPSTGNFQPAIYSELFQSARNNKRDQCFDLQRVSDQLGDVYQKGRTLGESLWALKVLMKELGLCGSRMMSPLYEGSLEEETELVSKMKQIMNSNSNKQ